MFRLLVISTILGIACGNAIDIPPLDGRIVGGKNTTIEAVPYQVSIRVYGFHSCGGSILNNVTILTAAHCIVNAKAHMLSVLSGSTDVFGRKDVFTVKEIIVYPDYNLSTSDGDVGLLILNSPITFSSSARPIQLASVAPAPGTEVFVTGWGRTNETGPISETLQVVELVILDKLTCRRQYLLESITKNMICTDGKGGGKDACQGDSGGPLVAGSEQVGIVSWGYGCARPNRPGIFTNVAEVRSWIEANTATDTDTVGVNLI